jgi:PTS system nitrogen regulatory IIA component
MKLTVNDAAKMLHVSETEVYRWIRDRAIPVHRVSDHYRFHRAELLEWATARGLRVSADDFRQHDEQHVEIPRLSDALEAGGVHHGVAGMDRRSVLRAVVDVMPIDEADRDLVYDFVLAREALGSTRVGDGIAIPHVKNPIVLHVARPTVTLCFLAEPVELGAAAAKPVDKIFSLVTSTVRAHLFLLSRLSAALHDARFKEAIVRRAPASEVLAEARRIEGGGSPT